MEGLPAAIYRCRSCGAAASSPADGPWSDYQQQQPAAGRDALGGYILPPQQPDLQ